MSNVLIVDDNPIDRKLAAGFIEKDGLSVTFAVNGKEALDQIEQRRPDLVLTDMLMPVMDGLELVQHIKSDFPGVPVILITAHGSEEIAVKALRGGASSYVPKQNLARDLVPTVHDVLSVAHAERDELRALECMSASDLHFVLRMNNGVGHEPLIGFLQHQLKNWELCDDADLIRVGTALHEAFVNAIEHGNLELDSELRHEPDGKYQKLADERRRIPPFCDRRVHVSAGLNRERAKFTIRDEGPGFDPEALPDPTDPENIGNISGRGLLLIRTFMDEVSFNETGNEITMVKAKAN